MRFSIFIVTIYVLVTITTVAIEMADRGSAEGGRAPSHYDDSPHKLRLEIGIPVTLLRNLNPALGLCNGTRLHVRHISQWLLTVKILNGSNEGDVPHIPRIDLIGNLPFHLKSRQFPIKVAFAISINKAQGLKPKASWHLSTMSCFRPWVTIYCTFSVLPSTNETYHGYF